MQRSSDSIGALAAALAKAQAEIAKSGKIPDRDHRLARSRARGAGPFAMRRSRPGSIWSASASASTRSQRCRRPPSTATAA